MRQYFGTDGIRGRVGEKLTADLCFKLGFSAGRIMRNETRGPVVIAHDGRQSHHTLMHAFVAGLSSTGVDSVCVGLLPTPAVAYLTRARNAQFGVMISASHNAAQDNGVKFFNAQGYKFDDDTERAIEAMLAEQIETVSNDACGQFAFDPDAADDYATYCLSCVPACTQRPLKVIVDCANGAASDVATKLFKQWGAEVTILSNTPNGTNINAQCGALHPEALQKAVLKEKADIGLAFDGDADRLIAVNEKGERVDGDEILYCLVMAAKKAGTLHGGVVGTQMTNFGFEQAMLTEAIPFERARVGDRYVLEKLLQNHWEYGGEASGHVICLSHNTTGDGPLTALKLLALMDHTQRPLSELTAGMHKMPQVMINVPLTGPLDLTAAPIEAAITTAETTLGDTGRVLLRLSGTEPLCRVMVEGENADVIQRLAEQLAETIRAYQVN